MSKVFGAGLGKTGTTSLTAALRILGYNTLHAAQPIDMRRLDAIDAATDTYIAVRYDLLATKYPAAKFILTTRDAEDWVTSWQRHASLIRPTAAIRKLRQRAFGQSNFDPQVWRTAFERHNTAVQSYFKHRPDALLVMDVCGGDSWSKLCRFLDKPVPSAAFPHKNKSTLTRAKSGGAALPPWC